MCTFYGRRLCTGWTLSLIHISVISPRHVDIVNAVFSPTESEIEYAHDVMDAIEDGKRQGKGVISLRGKMIDAPIVKRAQQVLEMEKAIYGGACR